jgi:hypothetical protein
MMSRVLIYEKKNKQIRVGPEPKLKADQNRSAQLGAETARTRCSY